MSHSIYLRSALARVVALGVVGGAVWGAGLVVADTSAADSGRVYELVSPVDKGGQAVFFAPGAAKVGIARASVDGDTAVYTSWGNLADARGGLPVTYRARRKASGGWQNEAVSPPPRGAYPDFPIAFSAAVWADAAKDLRIGYTSTRDPLDPGDINDAFDVYEVGPNGHTEIVSRGNGTERTTDSVGFVAAGSGAGSVSADGRHAVFSSASHLVPEDAGRAERTDLYERFEGRTYLVNQTDVGGELVNRCGSSFSSETTRNAISEDGSRIIFVTPAGSGADPDCSVPTEIYMRVGRERTIHVTATQRSPADTPRAKNYKGASADGDRIFFTSTERLTSTATTGGLYRYTVSTRRLEQLVRGSLALINIVKISADGSHVYFGSIQRFADEGVAGDSHLYVYSDEGIRLVARDPLIGFDAGVAAGIESVRQANVTPDGKRLLFTARGRLIDPRGRAGDFDNPGARTQVYLYDADAQSLTCLSCDPAGQRPAGSAPVSDAVLKWELNITDDNTPAITADGGTVVFETGDRLVPGDVNAKRDVYEYRDGRLSLVTTGRALNDAALVGMAGPDGRDVFFATGESLVPSDVDGGNVDLYDARIGGTVEVPVSPAPLPCLGDSCQPRSSQPPDLDPLGSEVFEGSGQIDDPDPPAEPRKSLAVVRPSRAAVGKLATTGRLRLTVRVSGGGTVRVRGTSRISGRNRQISNATKRIRASRKVTTQIQVRLNTAAKRTLARRGKLRVRLVVRLDGLSRQRALSITLNRNRT